MITFLCVHSTYLDQVLFCPRHCVARNARLYPRGFHSCCITHHNTAGGGNIQREKHFATSFAFIPSYWLFHSIVRIPPPGKKCVPLSLYYERKKYRESLFQITSPTASPPHRFPPAGFIVFKICLLILSFSPVRGITTPESLKWSFEL